MPIPTLKTNRLILRGFTAGGGRGLATEAAEEVRRWSFAEFGFDRLVSYIQPANTKSRRVAEKLGAVRENRIELRGFVTDVWVHPAPGRGIAA